MGEARGWGPVRGIVQSAFYNQMGCGPVSVISGFHHFLDCFGSAPGIGFPAPDVGPTSIVTIAQHPEAVAPRPCIP
jgi:hypothetical protein